MERNSTRDEGRQSVTVVKTDEELEAEEKAANEAAKAEAKAKRKKPGEAEQE